MVPAATPAAAGLTRSAAKRSPELMERPTAEEWDATDGAPAAAQDDAGHAESARSDRVDLGPIAHVQNLFWPQPPCPACIREPMGMRLEGVDLLVRGADGQGYVLRESELHELRSARVVGDDAQGQATVAKEAEQLVHAGLPAAAQVPQWPVEDPFIHHGPQAGLIDAGPPRRLGVLQVFEARRRLPQSAQLLTRAPEGHDRPADLERHAAVAEGKAAPFERHEQAQPPLVVEGAVHVEEDTAQGRPARGWSRAHGESPRRPGDSVRKALLRNHFSAGMSM